MRSEGSYCVCVCVCVCVCPRPSSATRDKLDILAVSVSCSLVFKKGVFRIMVEDSYSVPILTSAR